MRPSSLSTTPLPIDDLPQDFPQLARPLPPGNHRIQLAEDRLADLADAPPGIFPPAVAPPAPVPQLAPLSLPPAPSQDEEATYFFLDLAAYKDKERVSPSGMP